MLSSGYASECKQESCNAWMNCVDPDEEDTSRLCEEQQAVARGYKKSSKIAEMYEDRRLTGSCTDFAVCARIESGHCGWRKTSNKYDLCVAHPEKFF